MATDFRSTDLEVLIVGGGPSAVAAIGALLAAGDVRSITIVDPSEIGIGLVFGPRCAADPALLCNSGAGVTYVDETYPDEFVDFCASRGWPVGKDDYTPRFIFGEFCRDKYLRLAAEARARRIAIKHVRARVLTVQCLSAGYAVELDTGASLHASDVLLCVGIEEPILPALVARFRGHPRLFHGAYPADRLRNLPPGSRVLVLGLRSSALDASQVLIGAGHTTVMTSPSGRVSAVRDRLRISPRCYVNRDRWLELDSNDPEIESKVAALLVEEAVAAGDGLPVSEQMVPPSEPISRLRAEISLAEAGQTKWSDLTFHGIGVLNDMVGKWDAATRGRLLPKAYGILTRYVNALPLLIARRLLESLESGKAQISPVPLRAVRPDGEGWEVEWEGGRIDRFDAVVAATGYNFPRFPMRGSDRIVITHAGQLKPGDQLAKIGDDLQLDLGRTGKPERIWAIGPATNQRFPMAHIIFLGARHSRLVAAKLLMGENAGGQTHMPAGVPPMGVTA
jgi:hypothetical protein